MPRFRRRVNSRFARALVRKARRKIARRRRKSSFTRLAIKTGVVEVQRVQARFVDPRVTGPTDIVDGVLTARSNTDLKNMYADGTFFFPQCNDQRVTNLSYAAPHAAPQGDINGTVQHTFPYKPPFTPVRLIWNHELSYSFIPFPFPSRVSKEGTNPGIVGEEIVLRGLRASFGIGFRNTPAGQSGPDNRWFREYNELNWIRVSLVKFRLMPHTRNDGQTHGWYNPSIAQQMGNHLVQNLPNPMVPENRPMWKTSYRNGLSDRIKHPRINKMVPHDSTTPANPPFDPDYAYNNTAPYAMVNKLDEHEPFPIKELKRVVMFAKSENTERLDKTFRNWVVKIDKKIKLDPRKWQKDMGPTYDDPTADVFHGQYKEWYGLVVISNCAGELGNDDGNTSHVWYGFFLENPQLSVTYLP